jgi:hypothetical protein
LAHKHKLAKGQCDLNQIIGIGNIRGLSPNQKKIISLISHGMCQATISQRMKVSRAYICTEIKKLESRDLIKAVDIYPKVPGKRSYTKFYELSQQAKGQIQKGAPEEQFTACRIHNLRMRVSVISLSAPVSTDKRANYSKSWNMRGGERHKFWFSGKAGMPSITLDIHPKTIVAYVDKKQTIVAKTPTEAEDIGWRAIYAALDKFIELQSRFNVIVETAHTGTVIGKPHGGFVGSDSPVMEEGVRTKNWWIDRSQEAELGPGHPELETDVPENMTRLDNLIKVSEQVDLVKLPEMFQNIVNPIAANVLQVQAMVQGGIGISQQYEQMLNFMTKVLAEMAEMRKENAELKAKLGII